LPSPILAALLHGLQKQESAKVCRVVQEMDYYGTFAEGATYIGWAAIMLGIGPHSCSVFSYINISEDSVVPCSRCDVIFYYALLVVSDKSVVSERIFKIVQ